MVGTYFRNCDLFCPDLAVLMKGKGPEIDYDHCKGCGICVRECPHGALMLVDEARVSLSSG